MIHTELRSVDDTELTYRADTLARFVRSAPRFTDALRWWAGFDVRREPRIPDEDYNLDNRTALLLDLPPGTPVTRRDGFLVSAIAGDSYRVAAAVTLVHEPALALDHGQRDALRTGTTPLSQILRSGQRATHYAYRLAGDPDDDQPALRSRATLLSGGRPVALVCETVYWRLITHRAPGQQPRYVHVPQHGQPGGDTMRSSASPRTYPLGVGTLAIGTSGNSVTALLPAMSTHLHISTATAGQMFTVFAVTCALSGPAIAVATLRWERRRLLVAALTITGLGNALAAVASTVTMMIGARIITALGTAVYTAAAVAVAAYINEPQRQARAMSVVFSGLTLALFFGVPTSNALSRSLGYQGVFWLIAALCALSATAIMVIVPTVAAPATASLSERLAAAKDRRVIVVLATALFACTSTFAVYTYVAVVLPRTPGAHGGTTSALLAGYGVGAAIGNILGGRASDRWGPRRALLAAAATCTVLMLMLPITATTMAEPFTPIQGVEGSNTSTLVPLIEPLSNPSFAQVVQGLLDARPDRPTPRVRWLCRCGCECEVAKGRKFVNQDHYSTWLSRERFVGRHRR